MSSPIPPPPPPPPLPKESSSTPLSKESTKPNDQPNAVFSDIQTPQELTAFVETMLRQLQTKFDDLSTQLVNKMEDMDSRIDVLQKSLETLMQQANNDNIIVDDVNK
ncbi:heat shock factor binding protein 1-domain-containing protein [Gigaspora rosea]|uniref:Heat shock factor binding protein 1-domain-containing protein n=1 Tax=Gigaspora rosea TaxID=44941 RepID=A0A397UUC1_9GLOM|nr:heat shock factor binding protein 1-domain-containing protein [Gigaspora rosea]